MWFVRTRKQRRRREKVGKSVLKSLSRDVSYFVKRKCKTREMCTRKKNAWPNACWIIYKVTFVTLACTSASTVLIKKQRLLITLNFQFIVRVTSITKYEYKVCLFLLRKFNELVETRSVFDRKPIEDEEETASSAWLCFTSLLLWCLNCHCSHCHTEYILDRSLLSVMPCDFFSSATEWMISIERQRYISK